MTVDNQTFVKVTLSLCVLIDWLCIFTLKDNIKYMEVKVYGAQSKFLGPSKATNQ